MKIAMVVLADTDTHEGLARAVNAMMATREFDEAGDEVQLIFDGAGTQWPGVLSDPDHEAHDLYESVQSVVAGACDYCAEAFDATHEVQDAGVKLLDEYKRHPSFRSLKADGYDILTF